MSFTVGQLAKHTGLTVRALHHYDAIGLLKPSQRSESGYRLYTRTDVVRLYRIQALQRFGLSLSEIDEALMRDGATLPEMIAQQVEVLDAQIEQASALRGRLHDLRDMLTRGDEPATHEWLAAVELITQYDQYCSPEELRRLLKHNSDDMDDWRLLIADLHVAVKDRISPQSAQAQLLLKRWSTLMLRKVGGDMDLAIKMKLAFANDPAMQSRMEMQGGASPEMLQYLWQVMTHAHLMLWSRYLTTEEVGRLRLSAAWQQTLLKVMGGLRQEFKEGAEVDSPSVQRLVSDWDLLVDDFVGGQSELRPRIIAALQGDADLQSIWLSTSEIQEFIREVVGQGSCRANVSRGTGT